MISIGNHGLDSTLPAFSKAHQCRVTVPVRAQATLWTHRHYHRSLHNQILHRACHRNHHHIYLMFYQKSPIDRMWTIHLGKQISFTVYLWMTPLPKMQNSRRGLQLHRRSPVWELAEMMGMLEQHQGRYRGALHFQQIGQNCCLHWYSQSPKKRPFKSCGLATRRSGWLGCNRHRHRRSRKPWAWVRTGWPRRAKSLVKQVEAEVNHHDPFWLSCIIRNSLVCSCWPRQKGGKHDIASCTVHKYTGCR